MALRLAAICAIALSVEAFADSLSHWMTVELERAFDEAGVDDARRGTLIIEAADITRDVSLSRMPDCRLDGLAALARTAARQATVSGSSDRHNRFYFLRNLIIQLHSPSYEVAPSQEALAQLDVIVQVLRSAVEEQFPELVDEELLDEWQGEWLSDLYRKAKSCLNPAFKNPLPRDAFQALVEELKEEPLLSAFLLERLQKQQMREAGHLSPVEIEQRNDLENALTHSSFAPYAEHIRMSIETVPFWANRDAQLSTLKAGIGITMGIKIVAAWSSWAPQPIPIDPHAVESAFERAGVGQAEEQRVLSWESAMGE